MEYRFHRRQKIHTDQADYWQTGFWFSILGIVLFADICQNKTECWVEVKGMIE